MQPTYGSLTRASPPAQLEFLPAEDEEPVYVWAPASTEREHEHAATTDLVTLNCKDDYSIGLVDYCPIHGVHVGLMHAGGQRCNEHRKAVKAANRRRTEKIEAQAAKAAQAAWVRANGKHKEAKGAYWARSAGGGREHGPLDRTNYR